MQINNSLDKITLEECAAAAENGKNVVINAGRVIGFEEAKNKRESIISALKIGLELAKEKNSRHPSAGQVGTSPHKNKHNTIIPF